MAYVLRWWNGQDCYLSLNILAPINDVADALKNHPPTTQYKKLPVLSVGDALALELVRTLSCNVNKIAVTILLQ